MRLDANIVYNGFTFVPPTPVAAAPQHGAQIKHVRFSDVQGMGYLDKRALDDGMDAIDVFLGPRSVVIDAAIYGSTEAASWDLLGDLMTAFDPTVAYAADSANRGFLPMTFFRATADISTWPTSAFPNGIPLQMYLRPTIVPRYEVNMRATGGVDAQGGAIPVHIEMVARDPRIYYTTTRQVNVSTSSQTTPYRGGHLAGIQSLTFTMGGAGHSAATVAIDGYSVKINLSGASSGEAFKIDYATRHLTDVSTGFSRNDLYVTSFDQQFQRIQPGGSVVIGYNMSGVSLAALVYREAWV